MKFAYWHHIKYDAGLPILKLRLYISELAKISCETYARIFKNQSAQANKKPLVKRLSCAKKRNRISRFYLRIFCRFSFLIVIIAGAKTLSSPAVYAVDNRTPIYPMSIRSLVG